MTQTIIVALIVAAAVLYTVWTLMPAGWRRAGAARLAQQAARSGMEAETAREWQVRLERAGGCSECASCKGCATPRRNAG
ncbi:DUF6587 family protein [Ramlibacter sp.]|uniref:DUF6587 family protein n=1 Tax=Ramlibacter sp. TaxID=1917967 RepID=UPI002C3DEF45|nr:DUF6587 family protein [Ramlibacter sp.]HWI80755.1 DUF6587 family protein [Ramlibacter sp.]